jgi:nucleotide-binding universal stress UspA family protein
MTPITVYKLGEAYFVIDGNHRVSVAKQMGNKTIMAYVTEFDARVTLMPDDSPEDILRKAHYVEFLEQTNIDELRPKANLFMKNSDQYHVLLDQIEAKRFLMSLDPQRGEVTDDDAVIAWYDRVYTPMLQLIRKQGLERQFPGLSETDLYVLVLKHRQDLREDLGWHVDTVAVASDLAQQKGVLPGPAGTQVLQAVTPDILEAGPTPGEWRRERLAKRESDSLFVDILVAGRGVEADYNMVEHAALIAKRENGRLFALRIVEDEEETTSESIQNLRADFERFCQENGLPGEFATEVGQVPLKIVERSALADLLVLSLVQYSGPKTATGFGTDFNKILQRSPRPVLVIPEGADSKMDRALLAYDGSRKADEALYLAAYAARKWPLTLTVIAAGKEKAKMALQHAESYLTRRGVEASYILGDRPAFQAILESAKKLECNLIIMGGFGHRPALQLVVGSTVNKVIQETDLPVLICR